MASTLIAYATRYGQTEKIARRMEQTLRAEGHAVTLVRAKSAPRDLDTSRFDVVFVGGPVYAMRYPAELVRFVRQHRALLGRVPSAFFSVNLAVASRVNDGRAQTLPLVEGFQQKTGWRPARVELFAGALAYTRYNWLIRWMMRRISQKEGGDFDTSRDYEYTDWVAVDRFATEFAAANATRAEAAAAAPP